MIKLENVNKQLFACEGLDTEDEFAKYNVMFICDGKISRRERISAVDILETIRRMGGRTDISEVFESKQLKGNLVVIVK